MEMPCISSSSEPCVDILVGDCRAILPTLEYGGFSVVVTSPPYWHTRNYGGGMHEIGQTTTALGWLDEMSQCMTAVRPLLDPGGLVWLNLGDRFARDGSVMLLPYRAGLRLVDDGWFLRTDIVWHRPNAMPEPVRKRPVRCHETLLMLALGPHHRYDAAAVREPATMKPQRRLRARATNTQTATPVHRIGSDYRRPESGTDSPDGLRHLRSVWTIPTQPGRWGHPAPFPLALATRCLHASGCPKGSRVLDPFGGSGTLALAAWSLGLSCTLIELNADYAINAQRRLIESGIPAGCIDMKSFS